MYTFFPFSLTALALLLGSLLPAGLWAQEGIHASGGDIRHLHGTVSYSVGQVWVHTMGSPDYSLQAGVQQPFEIQLLTDLAPELDLRVSFRAYPNPTLDQLWLEAEGPLPARLQVRLCDLLGQVVLSQPIEQAETLFSLRGLAEGTYLLYLMRDDRPLKTFKIIKN
jgi:hypothetical protein